MQSFFVNGYVNRFAVNGYDEGRALVATPPPTMTFTHSEKLTLSANWGRISCQRIQKRSLFRLPPILFSKAGMPIRRFASIRANQGTGPKILPKSFGFSLANGLKLQYNAPHQGNSRNPFGTTMTIK
jgi:hypothetical protein